MKNIYLLILVIASIGCGTEAKQPSLKFFPANDTNIVYTGRVDFQNRKLPRFWQPGVYIDINFIGSNCDIILNDEVLWGQSHNYLEIVLDGVPRRIRMNNATDTITIARDIKGGIHHLQIVKNTEANIGYLEMVGILCDSLTKPSPASSKRIEFIGNSITCGASSDESSIPCGAGVWQDQHNAYLSYGAVTARSLNADYHLSSVSGIGLIHSCCNLDILMPSVFDKISMRDNKINWDFSRYQPHVVTVCLGQNDGIQDSASFCSNYILFIGKLRQYYPNASIVCLSSPMADARLRSFMVSMITSIRDIVNKAGDKKVYSYFFQKQYHSGCDGHPDIAEHKEIAGELTAFLKKTMNW